MAGASSNVSDAACSSDDEAYDLIDGFRDPVDETVNGEQKEKQARVENTIKPFSAEQNLCDKISSNTNQFSKSFVAIVVIALAIFAVSYYYQKPNDPSSSLSTCLAEEMAGRRLIKSVYHDYLGHYWLPVPIRASDLKTENKHWYIREHKERVYVQSYTAFPKMLSARSNGRIELVDRIEEDSMWTPVKNSEGKWSLKSAHGTYLRFQPNGDVSLQTHCRRDEEFQLESW